MTIALPRIPARYIRNSAIFMRVIGSQGARHMRVADTAKQPHGVAVALMNQEVGNRMASAVEHACKCVFFHGNLTLRVRIALRRKRADGRPVLAGKVDIRVEAIMRAQVVADGGQSLRRRNHIVTLRSSRRSTSGTPTPLRRLPISAPR